MWTYKQVLGREVSVYNNCGCGPLCPPVLWAWHESEAFHHIRDAGAAWAWDQCLRVLQGCWLRRTAWVGDGTWACAWGPWTPPVFCCLPWTLKTPASPMWLVTGPRLLHRWAGSKGAEQRPAQPQCPLTPHLLACGRQERTGHLEEAGKSPGGSDASRCSGVASRGSEEGGLVQCSTHQNTPEGSGRGADIQGWWVGKGAECWGTLQKDRWSRLSSPLAVRPLPGSAAPSPFSGCREAPVLEFLRRDRRGKEALAWEWKRLAWHGPRHWVLGAVCSPLLTIGKAHLVMWPSSQGHFPASLAWAQPCQQDGSWNNVSCPGAHLTGLSVCTPFFPPCWLGLWQEPHSALGLQVEAVRAAGLPTRSPVSELLLERQEASISFKPSPFQIGVIAVYPMGLPRWH